MENAKQKIFAALDAVVKVHGPFMGATSEENAGALLVYFPEFFEVEIDELVQYVQYVELWSWTPVIDRVKAFIDQGNLEAACDQVNMFVPDIQSYIYAELPIDMALELAEYDRTQ